MGMGYGYSKDLRERIVQAIEEGASTAEAAQRYGVCVRTAERYRSRYKTSGELGPQQIGGYCKPRLEGHEALVDAWSREHTLEEIVALCRERLGLEVGVTTVWKQLRRQGLSHKKKSAGRRAA